MTGNFDSTKLRNNQLSPLDQIRYAEAEITRRIAASHVVAKKIVADANSRAADELRNAKEYGRREGETNFSMILAEASEEADAILIRAQNRCNEITKRGQKRMDYALQCALDLIIAQNKETSNHEHTHGPD